MGGTLPYRWDSMGTFDPVEEQLRYRLQQTLHAARLVEERFAFPQRHLLLEEPVAETGQIQDLQPALFRLTQTPRELVAGHLRHHHVGHQDIERLHLLGDFDRFGAVPGRRRLVAGFAKHALDELSHRLLVVDDEHVDRRWGRPLHASRVIPDEAEYGVHLAFRTVAVHRLPSLHTSRAVLPLSPSISVPNQVPVISTLRRTASNFRLPPSNFPELGPRRPTSGHFFSWFAIFCHLISCSCIMT